MLHDIAHSIHSHLAANGFGWIDHYGGVVKPLLSGGAFAPLLCIEPGQCESSADIIRPQADKTAVLLFEGINTKYLGTEGSHKTQQFSTTAKMILWVNGCKLGHPACELHDCLVLSLIKALANFCATTPKGISIKKVTPAVPATSTVLEKYFKREQLYPNAETLVLEIDLTILWAIAPGCIENVEPQTELECC